MGKRATTIRSSLHTSNCVLVRLRDQTDNLNSEHAGIWNYCRLGSEMLLADP